MNDAAQASRGSFRPWAVLLLILVLLGLLTLIRQESPRPPDRPVVEDVYLPGTPLYSEGVERIPVQVLFPDKDLRLKKENREIFRSKERVNRLRQVMILLLKGPRADDLLRLLPEGVRLRELYLYEGCAYVDFKLEEKQVVGIGSLMEYLAVISIQNSLMRNFVEVEKVKILVNGRETDTLLGHIDIRNPFSDQEVRFRNNVEP